ncbi:MAG: hypothetical protein WA888_02330 [Burkholderiaceae bacterium]
MSIASFDPETWQPVRLPGNGEARSADFPPLDTFVNREHEAMKQWCQKNCRASWLPVPGDRGSAVFWFELPGDAQAFAMQWFPFKCL